MTAGDGSAARLWKDSAIASALGVVVALLAWVSGNSSIFPPELWNDVAVTAGIRPPPSAIPGLWTWLTAKLFAVTGLEGGLFLLRLLGPFSLGVLAVLVFQMFAEIVPDTLTLRLTRKGWSRRIVRFVLMQGACFFIFSDPVWRAGRVLSPTMLQLALSVVTLRLLFKALQTSRRAYAVAMAAVAGLLAADSPLGFVPVIAFPIIVIARAGGHAEDPLVLPFANPLVRVVTFRRMTLAFLFTWLLAMTLNMIFFKAQDGLAAHDWNAFTYFIHYIHRYAQLVAGAATPVGWLFVVGIVLVPLVVASVMVNRATDNDRFLPYLHGLLFTVVGLVSFMQSAGWHPFWFWQWVQAPPPVESTYLLCLCLLATSLTATFALCVLGVEIYFRNYRRIALIRYQDAVEEAPAAAQTVKSFRLIDRVVRAALIYEPLLAALAIVPFRFSAMEREMGQAVNDFAALTAAECGTAREVFTDGALDAAVEVAAALQKHPLKALSMMSGSDPYEIHLRMRDEVDEENRSMLATGAADALRTWVREKQACATNIALQLGFELWKHDKLPMPECGGVVARTAGFGADVTNGIAAAHALADRVLALYADGEPMDVPNGGLKTAFMFVQWRLARMCRMRSDAADHAGDMKTALAETERADRLDAKNAAYDRLRRQMEWVAHQKGVRLTPREGLRVGLDRADFRLARTFAQQVLVSDPYDTRANFAMGMGYFTEELYGRAEYYLKRCLVRKPNEPAVLNNLAIVQLRLGRIEEAETNATKALNIFPGSLEIKKTFDHISKAKSKKL